jgi:hypothetical protein
MVFIPPIRSWRITDLGHEDSGARGRRRQPPPLPHVFASRVVGRRTVRQKERRTEVFGRVCPAILLAAACLQVAPANAQQSQIVLDRGGSAVVLEPYAPNIMRVSLSLLKDAAKGAPGYGFIAAPSPQGWAYQHTEQKASSTIATTPCAAGMITTRPAGHRSACPSSSPIVATE